MGISRNMQGKAGSTVALAVTWSNDQTRCIMFKSICQETKIFSTWDQDSAELLSESVSHELFQ